MRLDINKRQSMVVQGVVLAAGMMVVMALVACTDDRRDSDHASAPTSGSKPPPSSVVEVQTLPAFGVVVTTSIVADWVSIIGNGRVEVSSLLPAGSDPHSYQPGPRAVGRIADADLVFTVGLGLEASWLEKLIRNASTDPSKIVVLGDGVDPIDLVETYDHGDEDHDDEHEGESHDGEDHDDDSDQDDHDHGTLDPHFWFDPLRVMRAVNDIADRLTVLDPEGGETYRGNAAAYGRELHELHAWIQEQVGVLPSERRLLVTSHDSLSYFGQVYGFEIVGTVFPEGQTDASPSAEDLTELVDAVEERSVPAVFGETTVRERLANAVADETGATVVRLYSGSLGPEGSGADTYIGMVRVNVERIVEALK